MGDISSLYPQPSNLAPQGVFAGNPLQTAGQLMALQQGQLGLQRMRSEQAVGSAFQNAIGPDGTFNPNAALMGVRNDPNAAFAAPGAITTGLAQQGSILDNRKREIDIATGKLNLGVANNNAANAIIAPLATQNSVTDEDVYNTKARLAAAGIDPRTVAAADLKSVVKAQKSAARSAVQNMGSGAAAQPTPGAPSANGAPTVVPLGATVGTQTRPTALSPQQAADISEYTTDQTRSSGISAGLRPLQNALPLIEKLNDVTNFGPGSKQFTKLKAALVNSGVIAPDTTDAAVRQEAGKYLMQNVTQAAGSGRSDEALNATISSNPNADTMLKPAVLATIKNKIAMDRQDAALPQAAQLRLKFGNNIPEGYKGYKTGYYQDTDLQAFKFDLMSPQERARYIKSLGPEDSPAFKRFKSTLDLAQQTKSLHSQSDLNSLIDTNAPSGGQ